MTLEVASQSAVAANPAEGTLDNPSLRQHDEAVSVTAAGDLQHPPPRPLHRRAHLRALVSGVANHAFENGKQPTHLPQPRLRTVTVLHIGRMDDHAKPQAERVGQDVALAPTVFFPAS